VSPRSFAAVVGVILVIIGFAVLARGTTVANPDGYGTLDCGSALSPRTEDLARRANVGQLTDAMLGLPEDAEPMAGVQSCEAALTTKHMFGWPLGGLGVLLLAGAAFLRTANSPQPERARSLMAWLTPSPATTRSDRPQQQEQDYDDTTVDDPSPSGDWVETSARKWERTRIKPRRGPSDS
jgi:hypothetical protein